MPFTGTNRKEETKFGLDEKELDVFDASCMRSIGYKNVCVKGLMGIVSFINFKELSKARVSIF